MKALSIRQPWAWLLMHGTKDIENRNWPTSVRGTIAIHAAKGMTRAEYDDAVHFVIGFNPALGAKIPTPRDLVRGAIIGTMELRGCVHQSESPWFQGPYGFRFDTPQPIDPIEARGALGFWEWTPPTNTTPSEPEVTQAGGKQSGTTQEQADHLCEVDGMSEILTEGMSEQEARIRKRFSDDMDPYYNDARYLIGVIDVLRWDRKLLRDSRDAAEAERHVSHCPHCEQRHSGSCQDLPRNTPIVGIDV